MPRGGCYGDPVFVKGLEKIYESFIKIIRSPVGSVRNERELGSMPAYVMLIRNTGFQTGETSWRPIEPFWGNGFKGVGGEARADPVTEFFMKIILGEYAGRAEI